MKIINKKNNIIFNVLLILSLITSSIFMHFISQADDATKTEDNTQNISQPYNANYSKVSRDTSISVDENGTLNISRTTHNPETSMGPSDTWTLLIYMTGSNLETDYECATSDIEEMLKANFTEENLNKVNVILQTGGAKKWHSNRITNDRIERLKVDTSSTALTNLARLDNANMGSPDTLYEFLDWGIENYPAEHMGVVFWDHGSGVQKGLCFDENYNDDSLSVHELEYAFAKINKKMTSKFELIGFDTCLTGSLEYASILAPYAKYMVGSADVAIAKGWYYTDIFNYLLEHPDATGAELGPVICDSTTLFLENYFNSKKTSGNYTFATYDLSKVDNACIQTNELAKYLYELLTNDPDAYQALKQFRSNSVYYDHNCVDMGSIINYFENSTTYSYDISNLKKALDELIIHSNYKNKFDSKKCGIGITLYIPTDTYTLQELNTYRNVCFSPYLLKYFEYMNTRTMTIDMSQFITIPWETSPYFYEPNFDFINYDIPFSNDNDNNVNLAVKDVLMTNTNYVADGFVNSWYNNVTYSQNANTRSVDTSDIEHTTQKRNGLYTVKDNSLICIGKDRKYTSNSLLNEYINKQWFALPDGQLLTAYIIDSNENTTIFSFPVLINDKEHSIRVEKTIASDNNITYTTLGIWDANDNPYNKDYVARGYLPLNKGTTIKPIYDVYNTKTHTYSTTYGNEYTINSTFEFIFTDLDKAQTVCGCEYKNTNGLYEIIYNNY